MPSKRNPSRNPSLFWAPLVYPVVWAEQEDEVPPWDASRGFDPRTLAESSAWFMNQDTLNDEGKVLDFFMGITRVKWQPSEPPGAYPRLVCAPLMDTRWHTDTDGIDDSTAVSNELSGLFRLLEADTQAASFPLQCQRLEGKFAKEVLELANRYGPATAPDKNTLWAWAKGSSVVSGHLRAMHELARLGDLVPEGNKRCKHFAEKLRDWQSELDKGLLKAVGTDPEVHPLYHSTWAELERLADRARNERELRKAISDSLFSGFQRAMQGNPTWTVGGTYVQVGVLGWCLYLLAHDWGHHGVRLCLGCGAAFMPRHGNQRMCDTSRSRCRTSKYRKQKKVRPQYDQQVRKAPNGEGT